MAARGQPRSVRLDASLTPDDAAATAERVHEFLVPAAEAVARGEVSVVVRVTAGVPEDINGVLVDPLQVWYSPNQVPMMSPTPSRSGRPERGE